MNRHKRRSREREIERQVVVMHGCQVSAQQSVNFFETLNDCLLRKTNGDVALVLSLPRMDQFFHRLNKSRILSL